MLSENICKQCHMNSLEASLEDAYKLPINLRNWNWNAEGSRLWKLGKVECPHSRTNSGVHVYAIKDEIPHCCPFALEHLIK